MKLTEGRRNWRRGKLSMGGRRGGVGRSFGALWHKDREPARVGSGHDGACLGRPKAVAGESAAAHSLEMRNRGGVWQRGMAGGADASKGMGWG